jgi:carbamoyltransferase
MPGGLVLGISAFYHDSAACLLREGRIVAAAQEERFTRHKGDARFPAKAAAYCLSAGGVEAGDLDAVVFYEKPLLKFERILETYLEIAPRGFASFRRAAPLWMKERLYIEREIRRALIGFSGPLLYCEHHESHAASAFWPSPFEEAAILTLDGVGEWATATIGRGTPTGLEILAELHFPHSPGLLYSAFTYSAGFRVNSGEYKLMGLAPYGEPRYSDVIRRELLDLRADGSFTLNQRYFDYRGGLRMTSRAFERLFGEPRHPDAPITTREMDLAASVQEVCEEIVMAMARHARALTGLPRLCMAGGVALNAVANGKLLRSGIFDDVWVQPAAGDAGGALGAAYVAWNRWFGGSRAQRSTDAMEGALLGPSYDSGIIRETLDDAGLRYETADPPALQRDVAELLAAGAVVGWFQGRMEFGPRALGARSILADARPDDMQSRINRKIKFREGFRPFAPCVRTEHAAKYFDLSRPTPYMTFVVPVCENRRIRPSVDVAGLARVAQRRSDIPAVTHVDYSARVQTVDETSNPLLYGLLGAFERISGAHVLVNTSMNVRGEPIVCSPQDAIRCFARTEMDALAIGPFLVERRDQGEALERLQAGSVRPPAD